MKAVIISLLVVITVAGLVFSENKGSNAGTYFPLVKNSYWVYKDSVYDPALEGEFIGTSTIVKDSITNVQTTDTGIIADVMEYFLAENDCQRVVVQYLQRGNLLHSRIKDKKMKWTKWEINCEIFPSENDTIIKDNFQRVYKKTINSDIGIFSLINIEPKAQKNFGYDIDFFAENIGYIGNAGDEFSHNLIEYRIGNGPVVKKHWLMENPLEKAKKH